MSEYLANKREAAAFFGVSTAALDRWFDAGCPVHERGENGAIAALDLSEMAQWRIGRGQETPLDKQRERLARAQADKAELDLQDKAGTLVRADDACEVVETMLAAVKGKLTALPLRLAHVVLDAAPRGLEAVQAVMKSGVTEALQELSSDRFADEVRGSVPRDAGRATAGEGRDRERVGGGKSGAERGGQRRAG